MGYNLTQINPAYELVKDVVVGTATTSVDFTGLNITKEDDLMLVSDITNGVSTGPSYYLQFNGNYTNINYYNQEMYADGTTVSSYRENTSFFHYNSGSTSKGSSRTNIKLTNNGYVVFQSHKNNYYGSSTTSLGKSYGTSVFTSDSITSIRITTNITSAIGAGSRFQLYKRKAPIVFDYTVSTARTSIDITGFTMDKGSEYQLVVTTVNSGATKMYVNGNTTDTNYYRQSLLSASTSVSSSRDNNPYINNYGGTNLFVVKLKLTNNGYYVWQTDSSTNIGGSSILIDNVYGTSTFTMSSITSLSLVSTTFAVGSRFQLIKLK